MLERFKDHEEALIRWTDDLSAFIDQRDGRILELEDISMLLEEELREKEVQVRNMIAMKRTNVRISNPLAAAPLMDHEENSFDRANGDVDVLSNLNESTVKNPNRVRQKRVDQIPVD